jgi:hypothetical protein
MKFARIALVLMLVLTVTSPAAHAAATKYSSCSSLNKAFKYGVAKSSTSVNKGSGPIQKPTTNASVYKLNASLDKDKDGIACEVLKPKAIDPGTTTDNYAGAKVPLQSCQLNETENQTGAGSKGFPVRRALPAVGEINILIAPIDFSNAVGVGDPGTMFIDDIAELSNWSTLYSQSQMTYKAKLASSNWIRAPRGADWYVCAECGKGQVVQKQSREAGFIELVRTLDPLVDFKDIDFIYFVFPYQAEREFGTSIQSWPINISTGEGTQSLSAYGEMAGFAMPASMDRRKIWDHLTHELLHYQGFIGHGPLNGSDLGIMMNQWGASKTPVGWESFLAGWFGETDVICLDASKLSGKASIALTSIDVANPGSKLVLAKLSDHEVIAIELRTDGKYTKLSGSREILAPSAVTAYRINVNAQNYRNDADPLAETKNFWAYLRDGGKISISEVTYGNLKITASVSGQISIEPTK